MTPRPTRRQKEHRRDRNTRTHTHTLRIGCTELKAVPHAGLGFHFLRVQVRKPEKEEEVQQVQQGHKVWRNHRTIDRQNDVVRSHLQIKTKTLCNTMSWGSGLSLVPFRWKFKQVRQSGQLWFHQIKWASSLVAVPSDLPLPPAINQIKIQKDPYDSKGYTHTPPRGEANIRLGRMCKCARREDKRMKTWKGRQTGQKCVWLQWKGKPSAQGQPMSPPHCRDLGDLTPELKVDVRVHTKARTVVRAKERKEWDERTWSTGRHEKKEEKKCVWRGKGERGTKWRGRKPMKPDLITTT